jgi:flagellar hook-associated protein 3 FlgL
MLTTPVSAGTAWFLDGVAQILQQQTEVQKQLSSGFRIEDAADSPADTPDVVRLGSGIASLQAYQTVLTRVQAEANTADQSLGSALSLVEKARTLAATGANSVSSSSDRQLLAQEVQGIQQQLVSLANTSVEGRYIFGGDDDATAPYQYDASSPTGADALTNSAATRVVVNPQGQEVFRGLTAQTIFDPRDPSGNPTASNAFAALQALVNGLNANDINAAGAAASALAGVSDYLSQQQSYYGSAEQTITAEQNSASDQSTDLQVQLSAVRDTDTTADATELTQLATDQSAAYAAQAAIPKKSLFDYLG